MAEDFHEQFDFGNREERISTLESDSAALSRGISPSYSSTPMTSRIATRGQ